LLLLATVKSLAPPQGGSRPCRPRPRQADIRARSHATLSTRDSDEGGALGQPRAGHKHTKALGLGELARARVVQRAALGRGRRARRLSQTRSPEAAGGYPACGVPGRGHLRC
jgi:hypothetical protein